MPDYYNPNNSYAEPPEDFETGPALARARRSPGLVWRDLYCIAVVIFFLFLGFSVPIQHQQLAALERDGLSVKATITGMRSTYYKSAHSYYLAVQFQAGNQLTNDEVEVQRAEYNVANVDGWALVTYLPSDPSICRFGRITKASVDSDDYIAKAAFFFGVALTFIVIAFIRYKLRYKAGRDYSSSFYDD